MMQVISDVACPGCGCVCDDLRLTCDQGRIVQIDPPCRLAERWYAGIGESNPPASLIDGIDAPVVDAIAKAAEILSAARAPLIYGLSRSSTAGQRAAVALAEQLGASIDTTASLCHGPAIMALQEVGEATSSLGEVRERADLVIFWGGDPQQTHPRHFERYSAEPRSELLPQGRQDRTLVVIDSEPNSTAAAADIVLHVPDRFDFETLNLLRMLLREQTGSLGEGSVRRDFHWPAKLVAQWDQWQDLVRRMIDCQCGVIFFGLGVSQAKLGHHIVAELLRLVAELNAHTHFYARRLRLHGDVTGADNVLCWQTGYPFSVSMNRGFPRYNPGEFAAHELLERNEIDAAVIVGTETLNWFSTEARERLKSIPSIVLDYPHITTPFTPTVLVHTAVYGVHRPGTVYRMDEIPVPLRGFIESDYLSDDEVLAQIGQACAERMR